MKKTHPVSTTYTKYIYSNFVLYALSTPKPPHYMRFESFKALTFSPGYHTHQHYPDYKASSSQC